MKFLVKGLKSAHERTGMSPYAIAKKTDIAINTVVKYTEDDVVETKQLWGIVVKLCEFYGLDWRDPNVIEVVEESPEKRTPLAVPA